MASSKTIMAVTIAVLTGLTGCRAIQSHERDRIQISNDRVILDRFRGWHARIFSYAF